MWQRQGVHKKNTAVTWYVGGKHPAGCDLPSSCFPSLSPDFDVYLSCHSFTSAWVLWSHFWEKNELLCIRRSTQDNSTVLKRASLGPLLPGSQLTFQYRCCNYVLQSIRLCVLGHFGVFVNKYTRPSDVIRLGGWYIIPYLTCTIMPLMLWDTKNNSKYVYSQLSKIWYR